MTQTDQNPTTKPAQVLVPLTTPEEVDGFLAEYPQAAVFKAGTCHKTMQGFGVLETFLAKHELPVGFIRVVDWRPASNHVAELSGFSTSRRSSLSSRTASPLSRSTTGTSRPKRSARCSRPRYRCVTARPRPRAQ